MTLLAGVLVTAAPVRGAPVAGPQGREHGPLRRQSWLLPSPQDGVLMHARVFKPAGRGPFPLAVINHGSTQSPLQRARLGPPSFPDLTMWFVGRGYAVVVPERPGHGATGGDYLEDQRGCDNADYVRAGLRTADSIMSAIRFMTRQRFIRRHGVVVVGQSAGGWGAVALASRNPREVRAVISFAGGRGGRVNNRPNSNCAPDHLVAAAAVFGRTARLPSLWIYTANDSYFAPALARRMAAAYHRGGAPLSFQLLPPFGAEGHELARGSGTAALWGPLLAEFLNGLR